MPSLIYVGLFYVALPILVVCATLWGGRDERAVAWLYVAALAGTKLLRSSAASSFIGLETGVLIVDALLLGALGTIAVRSGKGWVICGTAFQIIATLGHLGKLVNPDMSRMAYGLMESASSYPALAALAVGIFLHRRSANAAAAATSSRAS